MKTATRKTKALSIMLALVLCLSVLSIGSLSAQAAGKGVRVTNESELMAALANPAINEIILMNEIDIYFSNGMLIDRYILFSSFDNYLKPVQIRRNNFTIITVGAGEADGDNVVFCGNGNQVTIRSYDHNGNEIDSGPQFRPKYMPQ